MKVALCQINTTQGNLSGNANRILQAVTDAVGEGAQCVLLPELALPGYSPRDLLLRPSFVQSIGQIESELVGRFPPDVHVIFGSVIPNPESGHGLHNVAVHAQGGRVVSRQPKIRVPNYDVFDEGRYFASGPSSGPVDVCGVSTGLTICEDIWASGDAASEIPRYASDPIEDLKEGGVEWIANISASPYSIDRPGTREEVVSQAARRAGCPIALVNLVGGNDDVLFDGHSIVVDGKGKVVARAKGFCEDMILFEHDAGGTNRTKQPTEETDEESLERLQLALEMGIRDYARKSGFSSAILGLSGGIDSALTAVLAVGALGAGNVRGVAMPSRYSADMSLADARELAGTLGMDFSELAIEGAHEVILKELAPHLGDRPADVTEENVQPRIRGLYLMALSNKFGSLLLSTGNKSEIAVGYCTLYGDMCGGLAVLSDLPKTLVYALARHINRAQEIIPDRTLTRAPSAELRPEQRDTDSLPEYGVLDEILSLAIEGHQSTPEIVEAGYDEGTVRAVLGRVAKNEYKRNQMPPGLRVTTKAFGVGRRMPITGDPQSFEDPGPMETC